MEQNKNKKKKRIGFLLFLTMLGASVVTGSLYGYWTEGINAPDAVEKQNNTVNIGTGKRINGELVVSQEFAVTDKLVPNGRIPHSEGTGNVEFVEKTLTTLWRDTTNAVLVGDNVTGTLKIQAVAEFTDQGGANSDKLQELLQIAITTDNGATNMITTGKQIVLQGDTITSKLRLTLREPANKEDYLKVKGRPFKVKLTYVVSGVNS